VIVAARPAATHHHVVTDYPPRTISFLSNSTGDRSVVLAKIA